MRRIDRESAQLSYRLRVQSPGSRSPFRFRFQVVSFAETVQRCAAGWSIARFGDGELGLMRGVGLGFQPADRSLADALREVASLRAPRLGIGLPDVFSGLEWQTPVAAAHWRRHLRDRGRWWLKYFDSRQIYLNSFISRPYLDWQDKAWAGVRFDQLKSLWAERRLLVIEGERSRLGVGNDLFSSAKSLRRVVCPSVDAWRVNSEIFAAAQEFGHDSLCLLALGPTASVLAARLSQSGLHAVDIGHVDIEYEWFTAGADWKLPIAGKHVNEVSSIDAVDAGADHDAYRAQIIATVN